MAAITITAISNQMNKPKKRKTIQKSQDKGMIFLIINHYKVLYYLIIKMQTLRERCLLTSLHYNVK